MEAAEDFFAVPAFGMLPGAASQGCWEETPTVGSEQSAAPDIIPSPTSSHPGYHPIPAFAPRRRLRLGGEREETSAWKQDLPDKPHPNGFWSWPAGIEPGYPEPPLPGAGGSRGLV